MKEEVFVSMVGNNIKRIREIKGVSQVDLAYSCGFDKPNMSRIEAGKVNITLKTIHKIARALDVHPSELLAI